MKKSIERIWKEGFTNSDMSAIPQINNFETMQSIYYVDKFKKMYKTNIIFLAVTSVLVLFAFVVGGVPFIGLYMFAMFASLALFGQRKLNQLNALNVGASNYEFLTAFDRWLKNLLASFSLIYRLWIPLLFLGFVFGLLQTNFFVPFLGETLLNKLLNSQSIAIMLPFLILIIVVAAIALSYLSTFIFKREMRSIYGDVLGRLEQLLAELDELV